MLVDRRKYQNFWSGRSGGSWRLHSDMQSMYIIWQPHESGKIMCFCILVFPNFSKVEAAADRPPTVAFVGAIKNEKKCQKIRTKCQKTWKNEKMENVKNQKIEK